MGRGGGGGEDWGMEKGAREGRRIEELKSWMERQQKTAQGKGHWRSTRGGRRGREDEEGEEEGEINQISTTHGFQGLPSILVRAESDMP